ncbi:DUF4064 domain-containing protein [Bacillus norwichensis]|uniref:DUF4064 domain-containing protein n=1 Tax=Bacillus norwichensis TaxID=2762217 RepID=A0ABR8VQF4_9BACI|nr:DUF4064 domain-containing protein [Bacillus norwichensis]MBD8007003.1 DUF4064 domain-containing protein [Bacillus norwichensis]
MKRTGEITLGIIGIILSALMSLGGILLIWANQSGEIKTAMEDEFTSDPSLELNSGDVSMVLDAFGTFGWAIVVASIIGIILGLIGVISIKGNKKPKLAGSMFIIGAVLTGIISVGFGFLPAILYLIAGIMAFARKAPSESPAY